MRGEGRGVRGERRLVHERAHSRAHSFSVARREGLPVRPHRARRTGIGDPGSGERERVQESNTLTINTLANALYKVFCSSKDSSMEEMRRACFEYLRLGGSMSAGPIALLGGLETNPLTLVAHFFSVALFGVGRLMVPLPTPARIWKGVNLLKGAVTIIVPIVSGEGLIRMFVPSKYREKARII